MKQSTAPSALRVDFIWGWIGNTKPLVCNGMGLEGERAWDKNERDTQDGSCFFFFPHETHLKCQLLQKLSISGNLKSLCCLASLESRGTTLSSGGNLCNRRKRQKIGQQSQVTYTDGCFEMCKLQIHLWILGVKAGSGKIFSGQVGVKKREKWVIILLSKTTTWNFFKKFP